MSAPAATPAVTAGTAKTNGEPGANFVDDVDTCYDSLGRKQYETNPYQGPGWGPGTYHCPPMSSTPYDTFIYDALSRVTTVTKADGSAEQTNYFNFPIVTITDETGRQRQSITDGFESGNNRSILIELQGRVAATIVRPRNGEQASLLHPLVDPHQLLRERNAPVDAGARGTDRPSGLELIVDAHRLAEADDDRLLRFRDDREAAEQHEEQHEGDDRREQGAAPEDPRHCCGSCCCCCFLTSGSGR